MLYQLSYLGLNELPGLGKPGFPRASFILAGATGFEPAISGVTGRRPKPLGHAPTLCYVTSGGRKRTRTSNPLHVTQVLCQLSYPPLGYPIIAIKLRLSRLVNSLGNLFRLGLHFKAQSLFQKDVCPF